MNATQLIIQHNYGIRTSEQLTEHEPDETIEHFVWSTMVRQLTALDPQTLDCPSSRLTLMNLVLAIWNVSCLSIVSLV